MPPLPSRRQVADAAGISPDQQVIATRVHAVPRAEFERQVESENPPTITELARQGTKSWFLFLNFYFNAKFNG